MYKKKEGNRRNDRYCDFRRNDGHTRKTYFKLNGYPEWFKQRRNKHVTNLANTPLDEGQSNEQDGKLKQYDEWSSTNLTNMI